MNNLRVFGMSVLLAAAGLSGGCASTDEEEYPSLDKLTAGIFLEPAERATLPEGMDLRKVYEKGLNLTKLSEGFVSTLYNDAADYCTIAYGHLIKLAPCDGSEPPKFLNGVTEPEGAELLREDMENAEITVMTQVATELTDGQYAALCDFVYNVGGGNFKKSTLLKVVNANQHDSVPFQFRRWVKAGGRELPGLVTRREKEIALYFEGIGIPRAAPPEGEDLTPIDIRAGE